MIAIREHLVLVRRIRAARIHQIDAGQIVLGGNFLRSQMLLHRQWKVGAAFDGRIVADDHAIAPRDAADAGNQARSRCFVAIHSVGRGQSDLEKRCGWIEEARDAIARQHLAAGNMTLTRCRSAAVCGTRRCFLDGADRFGHRRAICPEALRIRRNLRLQNRHLSPGWLSDELSDQAVSANSSRPISMRLISEVPAPIS